MTTWLAFDIGTTGAKAALVDNAGHVLQSAIRDYPTHSAEGGIMEQDARDWWQAAIQAARSLDDPGQADAIALTGQMQDVILIDGDGEPIQPVILYSDTRARAEAEAIATMPLLRAMTGNDQDAGGLLAKLVWLARSKPEVFAKSAHLLLGAADFIAFKMTGQAVTDTTTASTTGLMDLGKRAALDRAIFKVLNFEDAHRLLPPMQPGGAHVGTLGQAAADALGVKAGIDVYHGPGDAGATTLGAGSGALGTAYAYLGTSGWVAFTATKPAEVGRGVITLAHPDPKLYIQVAPLLTAGGNLAWVRDLFDDDDYNVLIEKALAQTPGKLIYLPYLSGERAPFSDPLARGAFIGLDAHTAKPDLYRAVLEGVIYAYRHALDALMAKPPDSLTLTGGGTRSLAWCQLFADVIDVPVDVAGDAENVALRGAVLAAQVAAGQRDDYTPAGFFPVAQTLVPDQTNKVHFDAQYKIFRATYLALKPVFAAMAEE